MTPEKIKILRASLGWTSKQLAEYLGVAHNTVRRWECGVSRAKGVTGPVAKLLEQLEKRAERRLQPA